MVLIAFPCHAHILMKHFLMPFDLFRTFQGQKKVRTKFSTWHSSQLLFSAIFADQFSSYKTNFDCSRSIKRSPLAVFVCVSFRITKIVTNEIIRLLKPIHFDYTFVFEDTTVACTADFRRKSGNEFFRNWEATLRNKLNNFLLHV